MSRGRGRLVCGAVAALLALVVAGCGDDDEEQTQTSTGLTKPELVAKANAICKPHYDKITAEAQKMLAGGNLPTARQFANLATGTIIPETTAMISELKALDPADDIKPRYDQWIQTGEATLQMVKSNPRLLMNLENFKTLNTQADAVGVGDQCHVGPGT